MMDNLNRVKILLDIKDSLQDELLQTIEEVTTEHLLAYSGLGVVPPNLQYIIVEVMVKRFNRLGAEGMHSKNVEGASVEFEISDFYPYEKIIEKLTHSKGFKFI